MKRHTFLSKLSYASGTASFAVKDIAFGSFVLFYYTSVVGLDPALAGIVIFISMAWDALTDPIVGSLSDNYRSKWGRRHPFMAISGVPLAISLFALFVVPEGLGQMQIFSWMLIVCLLLRTFLTMFTVPYLALGAELSEDYHERSSITGIRTLLGWLIAISLVSGSWMFIFDSDGITDGRFVRENYFTFGLISFLIIAIFTTISIITTAKHIPDLPNGGDASQAFSFRKVALDMWHAMENKNFLFLFLVMLSLGVGVGVGTALGTHMGTYFWELSTEQLAAQSVFIFLPILFMMAIMEPLNKRLEKHFIVKVCTFIFAANTLWLVSFRLLGILPENGHPIIFPLILVGAFIGSATTIWFQTITSSIIADIGDEQELLTHERQEGVFFAAQGFSIKFVSGIGGFVGGLVLKFVELPVGAMPGEVAPEILFKMGLVMGPLLTLFMTVPFLLSRQILLSKGRHEEVRIALEARYAAAKSESSS